MKLPVRVCTSVGGGVFGEVLVEHLRQIGVSAKLDFIIPLADYWRGKASGAWRLRVKMYLLYPLRLLFIALFGSRQTFVVTSNPFFLPLPVLAAAFLRHHRVVYWLYDLYPDALVVSGSLRVGSWLERWIGRVTALMLSRCDATVFLGERLRDYAEARYAKTRRAAVIPVGSEGAHFDRSLPGAGENVRETGVTTILYSGHLGRMHDIETLLSALGASGDGVPSDTIGHEKHRPSIRLLFCADGPGVNKLKDGLGGSGETPLRRHLVLPRGTECGLEIEFNATMGTTDWVPVMLEAEAALVTMRPGAEKVVYPSKTYSAMLAGQAVLAVCPPSSDLAATILADNSGWVVIPEGCPQDSPTPIDQQVFRGARGFLEVLEVIVTRPDVVGQARRNAYQAAHARYRMEPVARQWAGLLEELEAPGEPAQSNPLPAGEDRAI